MRKQRTITILALICNPGNFVALNRFKSYGYKSKNSMSASMNKLTNKLVDEALLHPEKLSFFLHAHRDLKTAEYGYKLCMTKYVEGFAGNFWMMADLNIEEMFDRDEQHTTDILKAIGNNQK